MRTTARARATPRTRGRGKVDRRAPTPRTSPAAGGVRAPPVSSELPAPSSSQGRGAGRRGGGAGRSRRARGGGGDDVGAARRHARIHRRLERVAPESPSLTHTLTRRGPPRRSRDDPSRSSPSRYETPGRPGARANESAATVRDASRDASRNRERGVFVVYVCHHAVWAFPFPCVSNRPITNQKSTVCFRQCEGRCPLVEDDGNTRVYRNHRPGCCFLRFRGIVGCGVGPPQRGRAVSTRARTGRV